MRKRKSNYILKICLIVAFTAGLASLSAFGQSSAYQTFVNSNNKKVVSAGGRLVFYDGIGQNARSIADVNCLNQRVISSKQGKYFATCVRAINKTGPARIYNENGKKIGEFDLEPRWKVLAISDWGDFLVLGQIFEGSSPTPIRISDFQGKILIDRLENCEANHFKIALNGTPVIWGTKVKDGKRIAFVSMLDKNGQNAETFEYQNDGIWIREVWPAGNGMSFILEEAFRKNNSPNQISIWNAENGLIKKIDISDNFGSFQSVNAISLNGYYAVIGMSDRRIVFIDIRTGSVEFSRIIDDAFSGGFCFEQIIQVAVSDEGKILVVGFSKVSVAGYCVLDKTGKTIQSKVLEDFGNDANILGVIKIQDLDQGKFAIVHKTNKIEIIDLK